MSLSCLPFIRTALVPGVSVGPEFASIVPASIGTLLGPRWRGADEAHECRAYQCELVQRRSRP